MKTVSVSYEFGHCIEQTRNFAVEMKEREKRGESEEGRLG